MTEKQALTLSELHERLGQILRANPDYADLPVYLSEVKSRRTDVHHPIRYVYSGKYTVNGKTFVQCKSAIGKTPTEHKIEFRSY